VLEILTSATALLLLDQGSKRAMHSRGVEPAFAWGSIVRIRCVLNRNKLYRRAAARAALVAIWVLAVASATALCLLGIRFQGELALWGLGLAFGGSASNLFDILRDRYVVDFIDLGWWPVFNMADIAIVGGLIVAIYQ
jgi:signal peptidase II